MQQLPLSSQHIHVFIVGKEFVDLILVEVFNMPSSVDKYWSLRNSFGKRRSKENNEKMRKREEKS
jgi:hypothetical protein